MNQTYFETLPARGPVIAPFHAPLISRRVARSSMALNRLKGAFGSHISFEPKFLWADESEDVYHHEHLKQHKLRHPRTPDPVFVSGIFSKYTLTVFQDLSCFLSERVDGRLRILPQILSLCSRLDHIEDFEPSKPNQHVNRKIKVYAFPKHGIGIKGDDTMMEAYSHALEESVLFWAEHLSKLPKPTDPRSGQEGFWPPFAPLTKPDEEKIIKARKILDAICIIMMQRYNLTTSSINVRGRTTDFDECHKALSLDCRFYEQRFGQVPNGVPKSKTLREKIILHPNFPLQGKDWLQEPSDEKRGQILIHGSASSQLTHHNQFAAHHTIKTMMGDTLHNLLAKDTL